MSHLINFSAGYNFMYEKADFFQPQNNLEKKKFFSMKLISGKSYFLEKLSTFLTKYYVKTV